MPEFIAETCLPSCMANHGNSSQVETFSPFLSRLLVFLPLWPRKPSRSSQCWLEPHNSPLVTEMFWISSARVFVHELTLVCCCSNTVNDELPLFFPHPFPLSCPPPPPPPLSAPFLLSYLKLSGCLSGVPPPSGSWECSQGALAWHCVHDT